MSHGATRAGIDVAFAIEQDVHAANTYVQNHPDTELFNDDIRKFSSQRIKRIPRGKNGIVVFGGPPCQGFSYSNTRTRHVENENNWLFEEFVRFVRVWEPDYFVFENVRGIVDTAGGTFLEAVLNRFDKLGYTLSYDLLNAMHYGVAQDRARLFLIGTRSKTAVKLPPIRKTRIPTVSEAISDLPELENGANHSVLPYKSVASSKYAKGLRGRRKSCINNLVTRNANYVIKRYKHVPPGGNWQNIPARMMKNYEDPSRCHTGIYHRLDSGKPSVVIGNYRKNMLIHPTQNRGLSVREAARIQSFPDNYEFVGSIGFQQQCGRPTITENKSFIHAASLAA